jgi:hypothetical protein
VVNTQGSQPQCHARWPPCDEVLASNYVAGCGIESIRLRTTGTDAGEAVDIGLILVRDDRWLAADGFGCS